MRPVLLLLLSLLSSSLLGCQPGLPSPAEADVPGADPAVAITDEPTTPDEPSLDAGTLALATDPCSMLNPRAVPLEVYAQPDVSDGPVLDLLAHAQRSVRLMMYQFTSPTIREAVRAKAAAGLDVRVILDVTQTSTNQASFTTLSQAGAKVQWSDPAFSYTHAKVLIVDEQVALVSTGNFDTYMRSGRNFAAIDRDLRDVQALVALFDADQGHVAPDLSCTRLVVSPNNARARHLALIDSARSTLTIESMQLADFQVRRAVLARKQAGVKVRVLLAAPSWVSANASAGAWLTSNGVEGRWRSSPAVHAKAIVVDGAAAFIGSENLSRTSLDANREVGLVSTEADDVALVAATFEKDWATATPF